jgi:hypothetical protein
MIIRNNGYFQISNIVNCIFEMETQLASDRNLLGSFNISMKANLKASRHSI